MHRFIASLTVVVTSAALVIAAPAALGAKDSHGKQPAKHHPGKKHKAKRPTKTKTKTEHKRKPKQTPSTPQTTTPTAPTSTTTPTSPPTTTVPASVGSTITWAGIGSLQISMSYGAAMTLMGTPTSNTGQQVTYASGVTLMAGEDAGGNQPKQLYGLSVTSPAFQWQSTGIAVGSTLAALRAAGIAGLACNAAATSCTASAPANAISTVVTFALTSGAISSISVVVPG